jgi:hypothetical protein
LCKFTTELLGSIDGWVHFSRQRSLNAGKRGGDVVQTDLLADDQDIDIADLGFDAGRDGTVHEGELNVGRQRRETALQEFGDTEGFPDQSAQFIEYRTPTVDLEVGLPAFHGAGQDPGMSQAFQFPLYGSGAEAERLNNLALVKSPVDTIEEQPQHCLTSGTKEGRTNGIG